MKPSVFWLRQVSVGRIHASICRNDLTARLSTGRVSGFADRLGGETFFTLRVGSIYLNLDIDGR